MSTPNVNNIVIVGTDNSGPAFKSAQAGYKATAAAGADASQQLAQSGAAFLQSLERQAEAIGKTKTEIAAFRAQQLGVGEAAAPLIAKLRTTEQTVSKLGVSVGQTTAAFRTLPAQFTDIATQLAGGQSPFLILLQQGGQIKDSFGGIGPAFRALTSLITPLRLAIGGVAAGVGSLGLAFYEGSKEATAYNQALILSGGFAGKSASQLTDMAAAIGKGRGDTQLAAEALAGLTASGRIAGSEMQNVASAAVAMARATGASVDDIVKDFVRLADEPTKASAKLNEQFHYLTASVYEQIAALEENGRKNEAAALAENTYANAMRDRAASVLKNLGLLERGWNTVAGAARTAWNAMLDVGRSQSTGEKLGDLQKQLADRQARGPLNGLTGAAFEKGNQALRDQISLLQSTNIEERKFAGQRGEYLQTQEASIKAQERVKKQIEESASKQEKMNKALKEAKNDFDAIRKADPNSALLKKEADTYANIREKYKEAAGPKPKAFQDDAATKMVERLREQNAAVQEQLATTEKLTGAESERAKFNQLITDLKTKGQLTADQKSLVAAQDAIRAQLEVNVASEKALALKKKQTEEDEKRNQTMKAAAQMIEAINLRIESSATAQREQYDRQLGVFGLGSQAAEQLQSTQALRKENESIRLQFERDMAKNGLLGSQTYEDQSAKIKAALDSALAANADYWTQLRDKQADWRNGATTALQNYVDDINNIAKSTEQLFTTAFKGIEDGLTELVTTGKTSGKNLAKSLTDELTRGIIRQQITKPLAEWLQGDIKSGDSMFGKMFGGLLSNKSTGEDWLGGLLGTKKSGGDPLGDFIGKLGGTGAASAGASTTALAAGAQAATTAVLALAQASASAAAAMGGGGIADLLGKNTGALASLANSMPGDSLDNLFSLTGNFGSFATGIDFVPRDMYARIHKGEAIVRAGENLPRQRSGGGGYSQTVNLAVSGKVDARTQLQIAQEIRRQSNTAAARLS